MSPHSAASKRRDLAHGAASNRIGLDFEKTSALGEPYAEGAGPSFAVSGDVFDGAE
jgi:hypothetical protein